MLLSVSPISFKTSLKPVKGSAKIPVREFESASSLGTKSHAETRNPLILYIRRIIRTIFCKYMCDDTRHATCYVNLNDTNNMFWHIENIAIGKC